MKDIVDRVLKCIFYIFKKVDKNISMLGNAKGNTKKGLKMNFYGWKL